MSQDSSVFRSPAYGWVIVVLAALAMVATLPGRTHGLGMITERLLIDSSLQIDRKTFGDINFWATLCGAIFCIPAGWLLDRWGIRATVSLVVALLGLVVIGMTSAVGATAFAVLITLTRGLGQSALSVVSISMTGKWFRTRLPLATGLYSILVSIGFMAAFFWGKSQQELPWRTQWRGLGMLLLFGLTPLFLLLVRSAPDSPNEQFEVTSGELNSGQSDFSVNEALATPAFWLFGIAASLYGLVSAGVSLFNESLLIERGFEKSAFYDLGMMTTAIGLGSNLLTGFMATRIRITVLASLAMSLLAAALLGLQFVSTYSALVTYAIAMGCAGGMVTVLFFLVWAQLFGRTHLGRIQGIAQMMTVFASALGPRILADVKTRTGSYLPAIVCLGLVALVVAVAIVFVPIPKRENTLLNNSAMEPAVSS